MSNKKQGTIISHDETIKVTQSTTDIDAKETHLDSLASATEEVDNMDALDVDDASEDVA